MQWPCQPSSRCAVCSRRYAIYMHTHKHTNICTFVCVCVCVYVCMCVCVCNTIDAFDIHGCAFTDLLATRTHDCICTGFPRRRHVQPSARHGRQPRSALQQRSSCYYSRRHRLAVTCLRGQWCPYRVPRYVRDGCSWLCRSRTAPSSWRRWKPSLPSCLRGATVPE